MAGAHRGLAWQRVGISLHAVSAMVWHHGAMNTLTSESGFRLHSPYAPAGDQPQAIRQLVALAPA